MSRRERPSEAVSEALQRGFGSVWGCQTAVSEGHKNRSQCGQGARGYGLSRRERPSKSGSEALQRGFGSVWGCQTAISEGHKNRSAAKPPGEMA